MRACVCACVRACVHPLMLMLTLSPPPPDLIPPVEMLQKAEKPDHYDPQRGNSLDTWAFHGRSLSLCLSPPPLPSPCLSLRQSVLPDGQSSARWA